MRRNLPWLVLGGGAVGAMLLGGGRTSASSSPATALPGDTWVWPVPAFRGRAPVVSDGWGSPRRDRDGGRRTHRGVDVMFKRAHRGELATLCPPGSEHGTTWFFTPPQHAAIAAASGVVWSAGWTPRGNAVVLDHGRPWATFYAHLVTLEVERGQRVRAGQRLGVIGADPLDRRGLRHLHFALWRGGAGEAAVNPEPVMRRWSVVEVRDAAVA